MRASQSPVAGPAVGSPCSAAKNHKLGFVVQSCSAASWGGFAKTLSSSDVLLLLMQETHAEETKDEELRALAGKLGWRVVSSPAAPKEDGNPGGAAILARHWLGVSHICEELKGEIMPGGQPW